MTNRSIVRTGSALGAFLFAALLATAGAARATDTTITATYGSQTLHFTHVESSSAGTAVGIADPALADLLRDTGALLTWKPGERYVLITTSTPVVVSFAVGDRRYDVGPIALQAPFAPYQVGGDVYVPFDDLLRALDLALRRDATGTVLQPQLASLDVQSIGGRVALIAHAGAPLHPRVVTESAAAIVYEFDGVGTTIAGTRPVNGGGVRSVQVAQSGTARDPKTLVTVELLPGAAHDAPRSNDDRDVVLGFSGSGAPPAPVAYATPVPAMQATYVPPDPNAQVPLPGAAVGPAAPALVTGVVAQPSSSGTTVTVNVTGNASYTWHRLRDPDNRFWIDIAGAQLSGPPVDQNEPDPLISVRVRQIDPTTVRVAVSLTGQNQLDISPSATGLTIDVGREMTADAVREGTGTIGTTISTSELATPVTPAPPGQYAMPDPGWKFGGGASTYVPSNPRLIVIDPGHGGSDPGAARGGLTEASLTLDMAKRLRDILIARGWQVRMTRETDVDVFSPNDTAHEELQARDDIANNAGARLLVSIHVNSFLNSGPYGTTTYIAKPSDVALGDTLNRHLAADLGTKDDGVIKSHLYITLHALMPAALIETAFLSNPNDLALLQSPSWRQKVAESIADGIDDYTRAYPVSPQGGL